MTKEYKKLIDLKVEIAKGVLANSKSEDIENLEDFKDEFWINYMENKYGVESDYFQNVNIPEWVYEEAYILYQSFKEEN